MQDFKSDVASCARCGYDHKNIEFHVFSGAVPSDTWTHYGICPKSKQPILMQIVKDDTPYIDRIADQILNALHNHGDLKIIIAQVILDSGNDSHLAKEAFEILGD